MNHCPQGGYLVRGDLPLPTEAVDHDALGLPRLGCNRLRCKSCQAVVRSVAGRSGSNSNVTVGDLYERTDLATSLIPMRGVRLYLCRCSIWLQMSAEAALDDPDPDPKTPNVTWRCEGHPIAELPQELDGVQVTTDNLADLITRSLHGWTPPGTHPENTVAAYWTARMYVRFAQSPSADVIVRAAVACLDAPDPQACARAQHFFYLLPLPVGAQRALELLQGDRRLFADVPYRIEGIRNDDTLEQGLWRLAAPLIAAPGVARDLARADALTPGKGSPAVYGALASGDAEWVAAHVEDIARANPDQVKPLSNVIRWYFKRGLAEPVFDKLKALFPATH